VPFAISFHSWYSCSMLKDRRGTLNLKSGNICRKRDFDRKNQRAGYERL